MINQKGILFLILTQINFLSLIFFTTYTVDQIKYTNLLMIRLRKKQIYY